MAGSGQIKVHFNDSFFDQMLNSAGVRALTRGAAEKALGGFTTFSTYLLDFAVLCEKDSFFEASFYLLLSVAAGLAVLYAGMKTGAFVCGG